MQNEKRKSEQNKEFLLLRFLRRVQEFLCNFVFGAPIYLWRTLIALAFLLAGVLKLVNTPSKFAATISAYEVVPLWSVHFLTVVFPALEILLAIALLLPFPARHYSSSNTPIWRIAIWLIIGFDIVFIAIFAQAGIRGINLENCGCFGEYDSGIAWGIGKNILLLIFAIFALFNKQRKYWSIGIRIVILGDMRKFLGMINGVNKVWIMIALLFCSVVCGLTINMLREDAVNIFENYQPQEIDFEEQFMKSRKIKTEQSGDGFKEITENELGNFLKNNISDVPLIDARQDYFYKRKHHKNAINISVENFDKDFRNAQEKIKIAERIIVFCNYNCPAALQVAKRLRASGVVTRIDIAHQ